DRQAGDRGLSLGVFGWVRVAPQIGTFNPRNKVVQLYAFFSNSLAGRGQIQVIAQQLAATDQDAILALGGGNRGVWVPRGPGIGPSAGQQNARLTWQQVDEGDIA
nr:hypothetical protein [Tanacetum cinerariifolium]